MFRNGLWLTGFAALLAGPVAQAAVLVDQRAQLITHPGGGAGGADASRLQNTSLGMTSFGSTASDTGAFRVADDVTFALTTTINTITVYGYQTGSTTTSTMDTLHIQIWNGPPNAGGSLIFGDLTTNRMASTAFTSIYRDTETIVGNNQRPIMAVTSVDLSSVTPLTLNAGTYWIDFRLGGSLANGPFVPPITILGQTGAPDGNALQFNGTTWVAVDDGLAGLQRQGIPFRIEGAEVAADLQVAISDGSDLSVAGTVLTHQVVMSNAGPSPVTDARIRTNASNLTPGLWSCSVVSGAPTCPGNSGGELNHLVSLAPGDAVRFDMQSIVSGAVGQTLSRTVIVDAPFGPTEINPGNSTATDNNTIVDLLVFENSFESTTEALLRELAKRRAPQD
jgi:hypothetical protein